MCREVNFGPDAVSAALGAAPPWHPALNRQNPSMRLIVERRGEELTTVSESLTGLRVDRGRGRPLSSVFPLGRRWWWDEEEICD